MVDTFNNYITQQISSITEQHILHLQNHAIRVAGVGICEDVIASVQRLVALCSCPPESIPYSSYQEVSSCKAAVESFLQIMNQDMDNEFAETCLGQVLTRVTEWCAVVGSQYDISSDEVWDYLSPVTPDTLYNLGSGVFEAKWWPPVPRMDVEILRGTEGITILSEFFQTQPKGIFSVRFSITRT